MARPSLTSNAKGGTRMSTRRRRALVGLVLVLIAGGLPRGAGGASEAALQSAGFRAKPAVVMIGVRIGATATVRCSDGTSTTVRPAAIGELGSGSIIHPDGWIVTNGHVVQAYQEGRDGAFGAQLLQDTIS